MSEISRFAVGTKVWMPRFDATSARVTCPDCGGTGRLRVTFHDETTVSIECATCSHGWESPTGYVRVHDRQPTALLAEVTGMEISGSKFTYRIGNLGETSHWHVAEEVGVFATKEEALVRAAEMADEAQKEELARVYRKERDTRTWSWNATYHRNEIKRLKRDLERHEAKLAVASLKVKADKGAPQPAETHKLEAECA